MNKEISVIIPYYNEAKTILTTQDLLSRQTFRPKEMIFVDSGSTDGSYEIVQNWIENNRKRLAPVRYNNLRAGTKVPSSSRNEGIRISNGRIVAFMDCGLIFSTNWLEKQVDFMNAGDFEVVSGGCCLEGVILWDRAASAQTLWI